MNEPKKRGRPPKALTDAMAKTKNAVSSGPFGATEGENAAQAYALRVWSGQSRDVPRSERLKRVQAALEGQGLSMEGVEL